jgi:hypothetical protein
MVTDQIKALRETDNNKRGRMDSAFSGDMSSVQDWKEFPLAAKTALGFYVLLIICMGIFAITITNPSASLIEILGLVLLFGGALCLFGFTGPLEISFEINENGQIIGSRLTLSAQIIAVLAIISLFVGPVLYYLY